MLSSGRFGGTVPRNVPGGRRGHSEVSRGAAAGRRSLGRADSGSEAHIAAAFCPRRKASGKIHPSREVMSGAADTRAGDRDGPGALPGSAGDGGWPGGVVAGAFAVDKGRCSSAVPGHNGDRSRRPAHSRQHGKLVDGGQLRCGPPSSPQGGGWTTATDHVSLNTF